jgi:hypothetical protein
MSRRLGPAHVVLGIGANRLHDPSARASLIRDAAERGHDDVEVSECVDGAALRASASPAADGGPELVVASGEDGMGCKTAVVLADRGEVALQLRSGMGERCESAQVAEPLGGRGRLVTG